MAEFQETSFTNHLGQEIKVGDQVIAVSTGYSKNVRVRKGMYLGRRGNAPTVQVVETKRQWQLNGRKVPYSRDGASCVTITGTRRTTLPRGRIYPTT